MSRAARAWRLVFAIVGWIALALHYWLSIRAGTRSLVGSTVVFFSYFTVLTNVLVALALTAPAVAPASRLGRGSTSEGLRTALAMYIAVVGLVYHFLLAGAWDPHGLQAWVDGTLHYVMPAAFVLDWLLFTPKGRLRWIDPLKWLAFPLLYGLWIVVLGAIIGWYPYFFIDIAALGWGRALVNFGGLLVFFLVVGLAVVAIDRVLGRQHRRDSAASAV